MTLSSSRRAPSKNYTIEMTYGKRLLPPTRCALSHNRSIIHASQMKAGLF